MWSSYQEDLFKFGEAGTGNGLVVAVAGSGKTTALEELCRRLPSNKSVRYLVFNKKNADEAQVRMPSNVEAGTFHSASFAELRKSIGNTKVDGRKLYQLFRDDVGRDLLAGDRNKFESHVVRLVSLGKNHGVGILLPNNESSWRQLASEYSVDTAFDSDADVERLIEFAENLLIASNEQTRIIDFDDMLYLPVLMDVSYPRFDVICVDEAQDTNPIQKEILKKMVGDRIFAVGDPRQCQPAGTMVSLTGGGVKPIEDIVVGDQVVSYDRHSAAFVGRSVRGREVIDTSERDYEGELVVVKASNKVTKTTLDHRWLVRWNSNAKYLVYLMTKGCQARVGACQAFYSPSGFGPTRRAAQEKADKVWVLSAHSSKRDALLQEHFISATYGLPTLRWTTTESFDQKELDVFSNRIGNNLNRAQTCLRDFKRDFAFPIWSNQTENYVSGKKTFITQSSNLMSDVMSVNVYDQQKTHNWQPLKVSYERFSGKVYSLLVDTHELYVADGLLTHNSIYHFRGASSNAMDVIKQEFDCTELPLSINYRCSKEVITYAKEFCPQIEAWENAPQGSVQQLETFDPKDFQMTDAILCRTNAPNIELAYKLIRAGIPCTVLGRDIGKGLTALVRKLAGKAGGRMPLDEFLSRLDDYDRREMQRWLAKGEEAKYQNIHDKVESIGVIADGLPEEDRNVDKLIETIDGLFSDDSRGRLTLSTIHKAKGLEWKRVFFLNRENTPPFWATKNPAQSVQEDNLIYVAYTRAKEDLFFLPKGAVK